MYLAIIFIIFCTVLNGSFGKRASWKRSLHKTSAGPKISASANDLHNFVGNLSNPTTRFHYSASTLTNSTNLRIDYLTAKSDLNHSSNNTANSTHVGTTLLTSTIGSTSSEKSFANFTKTEDNYTKANLTSTNGPIFSKNSSVNINQSEDNLATAEVDFQQPSARHANLIDFISDLLKTEVDLNSSHNSFSNCTDIFNNLTSRQTHHNSSDNNTAVEDVELSGIIIYAPKEVKAFQQQTLFKTFQKLLSLFSSNIEQDEINSKNRDNIFDNEHMKFKLNITDFVQNTNDTVIKFSKALETTKGVDEAIESSVKQTLTKVASLSQADQEENEIITSQSTAANINKLTPSKQHPVDHNEKVENTSMNEHNLINKHTQPLENEEANNLAPMTSETLLKLKSHVKTIDKNTKYFFGEGSTEPGGGSSIYRTIEGNASNVTSNHNKKQQKFNNRDRIKKRTHSDRCTEKEGHCLQDRKESPTINFELQSGILEATKSKTAIPVTSRDLRQKAKDSTSTLDSIVDHSQTTGEDRFKMDVRDDFFKYKDWLWQHIEETKNVSLKSNSTENFLNVHHFLLNSGGTDQSATDASESNSLLYENNSNVPEIRPNIYKLLLEEDLNLDLTNNSNVSLKRYRRIKRSPKRSARKELNDEIITMEYEELTLPDAETESTFQTEIETTATDKVTVGVDTSTNKIIVNITVKTSESEIPVTSITKTVSTIVDTPTMVTTFQSELSSEETSGDVYSQGKDDSDSVTLAFMKADAANIFFTTDTSITVNVDETSDNVYIDDDEDSDSVSLDLESTTWETEAATEEETIFIITHNLMTVNISDKDAIAPKSSGGDFILSKKDINFEKEYNDGGGIRTRPLLLIVTLPSFFGIGIFILVLCYMTRNGGWCCRLFEVHRISQTSLKEAEQPPVPTDRRTIYY